MVAAIDLPAVHHLSDVEAVLEQIGQGANAKRAAANAAAESMSCWRRRLPVALLICRNAMRSAVEHAACSAMGQETRASFRLEATGCARSRPQSRPGRSSAAAWLR